MNVLFYHNDVASESVITSCIRQYIHVINGLNMQITWKHCIKLSDDANKNIEFPNISVKNREQNAMFVSHLKCHKINTLLYFYFYNELPFFNSPGMALKEYGPESIHDNNLSQSYNATVFYFDTISFLEHVLNQLFISKREFSQSRILPHNGFNNLIPTVQETNHFMEVGG